MPSRAVIFDLDGTLVDTLEDLTAAINAALRHFSLPARSAEACKMMIGNGANRFAERALPADRQDLAEKLLALTREYYRDNCFNDSRLYDGMGETVTQLRQKGLRLAVLTNKDHVVAGRIIEHFFGTGAFESVIGAAQDRLIKPDPGTTLAIVESMGLACDDFVFVGDSAVDIETALRPEYARSGRRGGFAEGANSKPPAPI
jgi:phosphoglycolate phosphatase